MAGIIDVGNFSSTGELLQQLALMHWLKKDDADSKKTYEQMTQLRVVSDVWHKLSGQDKIDAAQTKAILAISEYVKKNPRASKAEVTKFVSDEIVNFAATVDSL